MRKSRDSCDRTVPLELTIARAAALRERYGITRVADITHLDRIGIPVWSAVVPRSPDRIGVYNGKGPTREHAIASALMEAIERQICARCEMPQFVATAARVMERLDLTRLNWIGEASREIACVWGVDLLEGDRIAVPVDLVRHPLQTPGLFSHTSTNGLASGNNAAEAVYHALFELCERHLFSRVHLLAHLWPRALRVRAGMAPDAADDPVPSEVAVDAQTPKIGDLAARIQDAGLRLRLLAYAPKDWPAGMLACIAGEGDGLFYHVGMGCSWSPAHAAVRAITEAAQARVADMSAAREDLQAADSAHAGGFAHGRRPAGFPRGRWYYDGPAARRIELDDLPDRSQGDLQIEIDMLLAVFRAHGEGCVAYVDLSPPGIPVSVARVIAPTLERTLVDGTVSPRAAALLANPLSPFR